MGIAGLDGILDYLRRGLRPAPGDGESDGQLVGRLVGSRDEAAFTELLRRHGPLVWGVCRRVLGDGPDAEDSFQATFLVLLRKATSVRRRGSVRSWLYGVASRVAVRARQAARRRGDRERPLQEEPAQPRGAESLDDELRAVLDEELARLPPRYREPLVLCLLEGKTHEEAAQELGCPRGTVSVRVMRGRERLRAGLARRGLSAPAGALAAAGLGAAAQAAVPPALAAAAVRCTREFLSGGAVAGGVSPQVVALAKEVLKTMLLTRVRTAVAVMLAVVTAGLVMAAAYRPGATEQAAPAGGQGAKEDAPAAAAQNKDEAEALKKALVEEARKVYELDLARLRNLQGFSVDELYRWSRRWLEAELDLASKRRVRLTALRGHFTRMQAVERITDAMWKAGKTREAEAAAGRYYRAQAALWLAREQAEAKGNK